MMLRDRATAPVASSMSEEVVEPVLGYSKFVATPAQEPEVAEAVAELSADGRLDGDVAAGRGGTQALFG